VLVAITDLSLGGLVCPWVRDVRAPGIYIFTSYCMDLWPPALSCWLLGPSLAAAEGGQLWAMAGWLMGSAGIFLP